MACACACAWPACAIARGSAACASDTTWSSTSSSWPGWWALTRAGAWSICATALIDSRETVLGVGAIDLAVDADPGLLVTDDRATGLGPLLADALLGRALALLQSRAA